jgi:hypothetical protein
VWLCCRLTACDLPLVLLLLLLLPPADGRSTSQLGSGAHQVVSHLLRDCALCSCCRSCKLLLLLLLCQPALACTEHRVGCARHPAVTPYAQPNGDSPGNWLTVSIEPGGCWSSVKRSHIHTAARKAHNHKLYCCWCAGVGITTRRKRSVVRRRAAVPQTATASGTATPMTTCHLSQLTAGCSQTSVTASQASTGYACKLFNQPAS